MNVHKIGPQIKQINTEIEKRVNSQNSVYHLTQSQGLVVIYLSEKEKHTASQTELMELLHVAHTTTLTMLKSMARKKIIRITKNPQDLRANLVTLTWGDEKIYEQLHANARQNESVLLKGFSKDEIELFSSFLSRARRNLADNPVAEPAEEKGEQ
jgi:DNA-binding MarR family transcriptional regulator